MDMIEVLKRIHERIAQANERGEKWSMRSLSLQATGSPDTIRNWERATKAGKRVGANVDTVRKVANALSVSEEWLLTGEGTTSPARPEIDAEIMRHLDLLTDEEKRFLLAAARGYAAGRGGDKL